MYIITGDEIPWTQDGTRESGEERHWMQQRMTELVKDSGVPWFGASGPPDDRLQNSVTAIDGVIKQLSIDIAASTM